MHAIDKLVAYKIPMMRMAMIIVWRIFECTGNNINSRNARNQQDWCRCGKVIIV